jgi:hypothetical protein
MSYKDQDNACINGNLQQAPFFSKLEEVVDMPPKSLLKFDPCIIYIFKIFPATMATISVTYRNKQISCFRQPLLEKTMSSPVWT